MKFFKTALTLAALSASLSAQQCLNFKDNKDNKLCEMMLKEDISGKYINDFLANQQLQNRDGKTLKLISPKEVSTHRKKEKIANNALLKHMDKAEIFLKEHSEVFDYVEDTYQVDREIIVGILLKETRLGTYKPKHDALVTLNTVYRETEPTTKRNKWLHNLAKKNIVFLAKHCFRNNIKPSECRMPSSYIGAIGIPQFMPMNLYLAKSFENKTPDLTNVKDAIVSVGNYFNKMAKYEKLIDWSKIPDVSKVEKEWYDYEFKTENATFAKNKANLNCFSCGNKNNQELNAYVNKIMRYNNSSNYAIGVFRIAWELRKHRKNN